MKMYISSWRTAGQKSHTGDIEQSSASGREKLATYPVELHSEVSHQVGVFNAFKNLQLVCGLLNGFVIVWLEADLVDGEGNVRARFEI